MSEDKSYCRWSSHICEVLLTLETLRKADQISIQKFLFLLFWLLQIVICDAHEAPSAISTGFYKTLLQHLRKVYHSKLYSELRSCNHSFMIVLLNSALFPLGLTLLTVATKGISDLKMCSNGIWITHCQKFGCAVLMIISYFDPFIQSHYSYSGKHFKPSSCSRLLCRKRKTFTFFNQSTGYFFTKESSLRKHRYIFLTSILYKTSLMSYPQISFDLF